MLLRTIQIAQRDLTDEPGVGIDQPVALDRIHTHNESIEFSLKYCW